MKKTIKKLSVVIVFIFSLYCSYLSFFFFDVVVGNTLEGTYSGYSIGKEVLINTVETKDDLFGSVKKGFVKIYDGDKAAEMEAELEAKKRMDLEQEEARKKDQARTKTMLSILPYCLAIITFFIILTFCLNILVRLGKIYHKLYTWIKH